jgi:hypothetical protein
MVLKYVKMKLLKKYPSKLKTRKILISIQEIFWKIREPELKTSRILHLRLFYEYLGIFMKIQKNGSQICKNENF